MCDAIETCFTISRPQTQSCAVQHTYRRVPLVTSVGSIISDAVQSRVVTLDVLLLPENRVIDRTLTE